MIPHEFCHGSFFSGAGQPLFQWDLIVSQEHVYRKQIPEIEFRQELARTDLLFSVMEYGNHTHQVGLQQ